MADFQDNTFIVDQCINAGGGSFQWICHYDDEQTTAYIFDTELGCKGTETEINAYNFSAICDCDGFSAEEILGCTSISSATTTDELTETDISSTPISTDVTDSSTTQIVSDKNSTISDRMNRIQGTD